MNPKTPIQLRQLPSSWNCACCGKSHSGLPLDYCVEFPQYYLGWREGLSDKEIKKRCFVNSDICVVDDKYYFVRGVIEIPIIGFEDTFNWGAWVSASKKSFDEIIELWDKDPSGYGPYFGWLDSALNLYSPPTCGLKTNIHLRGGNLRPRIELQPTDHPLAVEQRNGMTIERVQEIAAALLHN